MEFITVKTRAFQTPQDNIFDLIDQYMPPLKNGDILLITSKIMAIHQGRCVPVDAAKKDSYSIAEADMYVPRHKVPGNFLLTVKENTLIPSAGIDESNSNGYYVLWPHNSTKLLKQIVTYLKKKYKLSKLAAIATDSHTIPLRRGVIGISIGFYGIEPLYDYRGSKDIFGRTLKITRTNIVDALAAMGVLLMGEGKEQTPMLIIRGAQFARFTTKDTSKDLTIPVKEDIYSPLFKVFTKKRKKK